MAHEICSKRLTGNYIPSFSRRSFKKIFRDRSCSADTRYLTTGGSHRSKAFAMATVLVYSTTDELLHIHVDFGYGHPS